MSATPPPAAVSTPGSHASASAPASAAPSVSAFMTSRPPRILACVLCQHRKIKCDRTFPCANCIKANVKCVPSTPAPARKRKRPNQDLQERLARCEALLKEYAAEKPDPLSSPRPSHSGVSEDLRWQPAGKLVKEDGTVRFVDSPMLGVIYDEVRAMRMMTIADDESEDGSPETMSMATPDENSDLLLGAGSSPRLRIEDLWPEPAHMLYLWQVYLDRVNPLTKIIHVPSLQPWVAKAAKSESLPKNIEALLFGVFLMAAVAQTPDECQERLGYSREAALQRYSSGVRTSLARRNFLKFHDLTTLQALVIYLISLQGRYDRHAVWILNGVAIRIAQKMGLHRDGETLGLPPFECEMRRRLWWQIILLDSKYAMFSGLSHTLLPTNCDTGPPRNVNDADLFPSATEPIQDRDGPTEMIFCLLTARFAKFLVDTPGFEGVVMLPVEDDDEGENTGPTEEQLTEYRRGVSVLREELVEILDKYSDPRAGPVHIMAITMREHLIERLRELGTPPKELPEWGTEVKSSEDYTFKMAVCAFEHNEADHISTKDRGFSWFSLLHFQLDIFMYMAGQLCRRTEGNLVERAWHQLSVVYSYHPELYDSTNRNHAALAVYVLKAWKKREQYLIARTGQLPDVPFYVWELRRRMPGLDEQEAVEPTPPNIWFPPDFIDIDVPEAAAVDASLALDNLLGFLEVQEPQWMNPGAGAGNPQMINPLFPFDMRLPSQHQ